MAVLELFLRPLPYTLREVARNGGVWGIAGGARHGGEARKLHVVTFDSTYLCALLLSFRVRPGSVVFWYRPRPPVVAPLLVLCWLIVVLAVAAAVVALLLSFHRSSLLVAGGGFVH